MAAASTQDITQLLKAWGGGDKAALDDLTRLCYQELRRIALQHMRRHKRGFIIATAVFVALMTGGSIGLYRWLSRERTPNGVSGPAAKIIPFTSYPGAEADPSFSPRTPSSIQLLSIETFETRRLTSPSAGTLGDGSPAISPDGRTLAFTRRGSNDTDDIYLAPVSGGESKRLTSDNSRITGLAWTSDGREIVFSSNRAGTRHLWKVPASGGTPEHVPAGGENPDTLAITRQGRLLAYTSVHSDTNIWRIEVEGARAARS